MKPKNSTERKLVRYAEALPAITDRQRRWAYANCFTPMAVYRRRGSWVKCLCCGNEQIWNKSLLESFIDVDEYCCPECGRSMALKEKFKDTVLTEQKFFTVITTFRGIQLARTFDAVRANSLRESAEYSIGEIFQNWILPDGSEVITGRPHHRSPFSLSFNYDMPYCIKHHNANCSGYYRMDDLFDICGTTLYPIVRVTPLVRRNGWRPELLRYHSSISMVDAISWLLKCPTAEMMCKTGQLDLFRHMVREVKTEFEYLHAVRIANRRKYTVSDSSLWIDMLNMADRIGLDTHNPDIVCPADLRSAHDRILARYARIVKAEKGLSDEVKAAKAEEEYSLTKGRYRGIEIEGDGIRVSMIPTVVEILREGKAMHHCVFAMEYYKRPDCLILSARDRDGKRIETVEFSLKTFKVLQSRGVCNTVTPRHNEIVSLIENHASLFRQCEKTS